mmetsp:Transcript_278/g.868  ORF Transcript_278/g.868 Transcript_278/m.868 type:complete len:597 (-) Transcript_278:1548-3338(-)
MAQSRIGREPRSRVHPEQAGDEVLRLGGDPSPFPLREGEGAGRDFAEELPLVWGVEGHVAAEQDVGHHAQRPHVHRSAVGLVLHDLGREVVWGARQRAEGLARAAVHREAEVGDLHGGVGARVLEQDVLGLDVPMHDAVLVEVADGVEQDVHCAGSLLLREPGLRNHAVEQLAALAELGDEVEVRGVVVEEGHEAHDVGVPHPALRGHLADQALHVVPGHGCAIEHLHGKLPARPAVSRLVHHAEGAPAEDLPQLEQVLEPRLLLGRRGGVGRHAGGPLRAVCRRRPGRAAASSEAVGAGAAPSRLLALDALAEHGAPQRDARASRPSGQARRSKRGHAGAASAAGWAGARAAQPQMGGRRADRQAHPPGRAGGAKRPCRARGGSSAPGRPGGRPEEAAEPATGGVWSADGRRPKPRRRGPACGGSHCRASARCRRRERSGHGALASRRDPQRGGAAAVRAGRGVGRGAWRGARGGGRWRAAWRHGKDWPAGRRRRLCCLGLGSGERGGSGRDCRGCRSRLGSRSRSRRHRRGLAMRGVLAAAACRRGQRLQSARAPRPRGTAAAAAVAARAAAAATHVPGLPGCQRRQRRGWSGC